MIFTSITFLLFFTLVYMMYWSMPGAKGKKFWLLMASMVFYASWSLPFFLHFLLVVLINYAILKQIYKTGSKKWTIFAVVLNLTNLGFFKYFYFLTEILSDITGIPLLAQLQSSSWKIILPLAISFYTFQILAFTIDVYRKHYQEPIELLDYTIFIMFFPQLIAGPIMRPHDFLPTLKGQGHLETDSQWQAMTLISIGVIKKILIADNLAFIIDPIWNHPQEYSGFTALLAFHAFSWQIYCDFSGYTDVARGIALLMGFRIPENFKAPFLASSPTECWQRWHITLSSWMRDYIYIPLGGNRVSERRNHLNTIITFTLGGLWHGAAWTYILWGFFHGIMLSLERLFRKYNGSRFFSHRLAKILGVILTYHIFIIGAGMFRARSIADFWTLSRAIVLNLPGKGVLVETTLYLCAFALLLQVVEYKNWQYPQILQKMRPVLLPISFLLLVFLIGLYGVGGKEFVYFQF